MNELVPGKYLAAHLRMRYPKRFVRPIQQIDVASKDTNDLKMSRGWAENSIYYQNSRCRFIH